MAYKVMLSTKLSFNLCKTGFRKLLSNHTRISRTRPTVQVSKYGTKSDSNNEDDEEMEVFEGFEDEGPGVLTDEQIQEKRDVSRLPRVYHSMMDHVRDVSYIKEQNQPFQEHMTYKRRMYAKYGKESGLDPGIMWVTKDELASLIEDDKEWDPTLQQMWQNIEEYNQKDEAWKRKKEDHVTAQLEKMPKYIEQFKAAREARRGMAKELAEKKKNLLDDARDYFGYNLHPNDPRLQQMIEERKIEEEQAKKKKKKEEKKAKVARLLALQLGSKQRPAKAKPSKEVEEGS